ncbi:hypothetical protein [Frigoribacterium sp. CG_9.8]|uniref:hypothetical protein n=1 Tax=Frigoribacterium sp. CG_9.8 TaxID=2787733 RepID=UPI0018C8EEF2|nr:hypothetical protein [Frigoribacterium sp. CG_9.8]MBG6108636.1 hypothetical protein [Frigoribacterium sp. CG_9.8]
MPDLRAGILRAGIATTGVTERLMALLDTVGALSMIDGILQRAGLVVAGTPPCGWSRITQ